MGSDGLIELSTESLDTVLLKPITGRLKAYIVFFLALLRRRDALLYRNQFYVSFFFFGTKEISVHPYVGNYRSEMS